MSDVTYPDVHVELSELDGNIFVLIGSVTRAIRRVHGNDAAEKFKEDARSQGSYDKVIQFIMSTVETS